MRAKDQVLEPLTRTSDVPLSEAQWRSERFGYWTGKANIAFLRSECRYRWATKTAVTRFLYTRIFPREIYSFRPHHDDPLIFHCPNGTQIRLGEMEYDFGSVPRCLQLFVEKDQYPHAFAGHDFMYNFNGAFFRRPEALIRDSQYLEYLDYLPAKAHQISHHWQFIPVTQQQADSFLFTACGAENALWIQRELVWSAVRLAGWSVWTKWDGPEPTL